MLTPYLEKLIHEGKAEYREQAVGGSGVATIPVQTGQKIVITDFTWHPFTDQQIVATDFFINYFPLVIFGYNPSISGSQNIGDIMQANDVLNNQIGLGRIFLINIISPTFAQMLVAVESGDFNTTNSLINLTTGDPVVYSVFASASLFTPVEGLLDFDTGGTGVILSNTPTGTPGMSPGQLHVTIDPLSLFGSGDVITGTTSGAAAIQDGAAAPDPGTIDLPATIESAIANSLHHLRFKSKGKIFIYNFRDTINGLIEISGELTTIAGYALPDPIQVHTYMFCDETVQIDIWKFSPSGNAFVTFQPPAKANEPVVPNGYSGAVAHPPVQRIVTAQGATIVPLGQSRSNISAGNPRLKDQLVDDIGDLTELNRPIGNQSFPLVNIGYVLIRNM